ncbi:MAG: sugar ABC transporter permease, partial [Lachnospiraceae bacterium]|nr:sugar ABC transporter permease [Lachnospiraceae bacterium]
MKNISALFLTPSFFGVAVFFVVPFLVVIYYSLIDNPISHQFVFLDNFRNVLMNHAFRQAVKNTFTFSFSAVPLAVVFSLLAAFALDKAIPWKSKIRTALLSPMMVPIASVILIWQVLFHYNGVVYEVLQYFGGGMIDWLKSVYGHVVIVILFIWKNLGYNMILFMAALSSIPKEIIEVARMESAT